MLEGGAVSERRERRLTNEARSAAGRCLEEEKTKSPYQAHLKFGDLYPEIDVTDVELKNSSVRRKNRLRYFR